MRALSQPTSTAVRVRPTAPYDALGLEALVVHPEGLLTLDIVDAVIGTQDVGIGGEGIAGAHGILQ